MKTALRVSCVIAFTVTLIACDSDPPSVSSGVEPAGNAADLAPVAAVEMPTNSMLVVPLHDGVPHGLSGLSIDRAGELWAVPEESRFIVNLKKDGTHVKVPLVGIPNTLELESLTWIDDNRIAVGTESNALDRDHDPILVLVGGPNGFTVYHELEFSYGAWGTKCKPNIGVEGLCSAAGQIVAVGEVVLGPEGDRRAPIARQDFEAGQWQSAQVALTSKKGKLAALACRASGKGIEYLAIERHFGLLRVLRWQTPSLALPARIEPEVIADLSHTLSVNLEGISWTRDGMIAIVTDNQFHGSHEGHGELILLRSPAAPTAGSGQSMSPAIPAQDTH